MPPTARRRMKPTTIRFGMTVHEIIESAAASEGVSFSQYVREAALLRAVYERSQTGKATFGQAEIIELLRQAREDDGEDD